MGECRSQEKTSIIDKKQEVEGFIVFEAGCPQIFADFAQIECEKRLPKKE